MNEIAIVAAPLAERIEYAKALSPADLLPPAFRGKPANILLAMEAGQSLGKSAMEIMVNSHVISGKLGFSAEFQRALVLSSGHKIRVSMEGTTAVAIGVRSDDPDFVYEVRWDLDRARREGMGTSENWKKHPQSMLKARATTELCRDAFADVIRGYRTAEELQDMAGTPHVATQRPGDSLRAAVGIHTDVVEAEVVDDYDGEAEAAELFAAEQD